jgi:hypothetical protein
LLKPSNWRATTAHAFWPSPAPIRRWRNWPMCCCRCKARKPVHLQTDGGALRHVAGHRPAATELALAILKTIKSVCGGSNSPWTNTVAATITCRWETDMSTTR